MTKPRLIFMRHGQTAHNQAGRIQGLLDIELSAAGQLAVVAKAHSLLEQGFEVDLIVSSSLLRAQQTAVLIGNVIERSVLVVDHLQELNFGDWEGLTWEEVKFQYQKEYQHWKGNRLHTNVPNGESYYDMIIRVQRAIRHILTLSDEPILVVGHSLTMMVLKCLLANDAFEHVLKYAMSNLDMIEFSQADVDTILSFN